MESGKKMIESESLINSRTTWKWQRAKPHNYTPFPNLNGDVDGEMGVDGLHLVTKSVGDALHHVLDVADHGTDRRDVFAIAEPFLSLKSAIRRKGQVDRLING